ncbi:MAG: TIR domain-containing protein, partial [Candidatus Hydrogenedentes bacterium]|nr:TIR domain-containing protein [Candidatus Hydrogenedentota bacterium]
MPIRRPKVFISYSWTTETHEEWVLQLAIALEENGINAILDKWDLKEGQDTFAFMERMVSDPDVQKVLLICDKGYAEKADRRSGGVGAEAQIITPELYGKTEQGKFVAVLAERDEEGNPYLPSYYKSRLYIDLSDEHYAGGFERLLRWAFDKPLHVRPDPGRAPAYITDDSPISLGTSSKLRAAMEAIRSEKALWRVITEDYLETLVKNLEILRIEGNPEPIDEAVINALEQFLPFRNEAIELFQTLARYTQDGNSSDLLHRFFESLVPYLQPPINCQQWNDGHLDVYRFIIQELFLYAVACLLKNEKFETTAHLLNTLYYVERPRNLGDENMLSFDIFWQEMRTLDHRKSRLQLNNRLSIRSDLLQQRSSGCGVSFQSLMQADFVLFMHRSVKAMDNADQHSCNMWYPD